MTIKGTSAKDAFLLAHIVHVIVVWYDMILQKFNLLINISNQSPAGVNQIQSKKEALYSLIQKLGHVIVAVLTGYIYRWHAPLVVHVDCLLGTFQIQQVTSELYQPKASREMKQRTSILYPWKAQHK